MWLVQKRGAEELSLVITMSDSVAKVAARIEPHGGRLDSGPADVPWGARAFRVCDPDGFRFAVSSRPYAFRFLSPPCGRPGGTRIGAVNHHFPIRIHAYG